MGSRGPKAKIETNPEVVEKLLVLIRAGNYIETAAAGIGMGRDTLYRWMKAYPWFREKVTEAVSVSEAADLQNIARAARDGAWQASAWRLERRFPERWARRDRAEVPEDQVPKPGVGGVVVLPAEGD